MWLSYGNVLSFNTVANIQGTHRASMGDNVGRFHNILSISQSFIFLGIILIKGVFVAYYSNAIIFFSVEKTNIQVED